MQESFHELGVSRARLGARRARYQRAVPDPGARHPRRARRARRAREVADRLGQDPRLRHPDRRAPRGRRRRRRGARPRADPRARLAGRPRSIAAIAKARGLCVAAVYGGVSLRAQAKRAQRRTSSSPRPAGSSDLLERAVLCARAASGSSCSTRPTACSTWASSRRSTGSSAGCRGPPDDVLLRDARRQGRRAGRAYTTRPGAASRPSCADRASRRRSRTASCRSRRRPRSRRSSSSSRRERGRALVFVRTKRGADRLVEKLQRHGVTRGRRCTATRRSGRASARSTRFERARRGARRDRRRGPRPRHRRHQPRHQLRSAGRRPGSPGRSRTARASRRRASFCRGRRAP